MKFKVCFQTSMVLVLAEGPQLDLPVWPTLCRTSSGSCCPPLNAAWRRFMPCSLSWLPSATRSLLRRSAVVVEKLSALSAENITKPLQVPCLAARSLTPWFMSCLLRIFCTLEEAPGSLLQEAKLQAFARLASRVHPLTSLIFGPASWGCEAFLQKLYAGGANAGGRRTSRMWSLACKLCKSFIVS